MLSFGPIACRRNALADSLWEGCLWYSNIENVGSGPIAQWSEQVTHNHLVGGPNPSGPKFVNR